MRKNSADDRAIHGKARVQRADGKVVQIPVLREVSLPMKWTLEGNPGQLREIPHVIRSRAIAFAIALALMSPVWMHAGQGARLRTDWRNQHAA